MTVRILYSFIVDQSFLFTHQAYHLAQSILKHCQASPVDIHIHLTKEVTSAVYDYFQQQGFTIHTLERFLDGTYCNKLTQIPRILEMMNLETYDLIVLLDTDTLILNDIRPFIDPEFIQGKIADCENPSLQTLCQLLCKVQGTDTKKIVHLDTSLEKQTVFGNFNGGFYAIPKQFAATLSLEWVKWATYLFDEYPKPSPISNNIDQISFCLSLYSAQLIQYTRLVPSNLNYFIHMDRPHYYEDKSVPISIIHYHNTCMNKETGLLMTLHDSYRLLTDAANLQFQTRKKADHLCNNNKNHHHIFAYWNNPETQYQIQSFYNEWSAYFPKFQIYHDSNIITILDRYFLYFQPLYEKIQLPSPKSDIARFCLLYEYGGTYVDCHTGIRDGYSKDITVHTIQDIFQFIDNPKSAIELLVVDRQLSQEPRPEDQHFILTSMISCKPKCQIIYQCLRQAIENLQYQFHAEQRIGTGSIIKTRDIQVQGIPESIQKLLNESPIHIPACSNHVPYHCGSVTGPDLFTSMILQPGSMNRQIREDYMGKVLIIPEEVFPIVRNKHRTYYRDGESHWFEKQKTCRLFL